MGLFLGCLLGFEFFPPRKAAREKIKERRRRRGKAAPCTPSRCAWLGHSPRVWVVSRVRDSGSRSAFTPDFIFRSFLRCLKWRRSSLLLGRARLAGRASGPPRPLVPWPERRAVLELLLLDSSASGLAVVGWLFGAGRGLGKGASVCEPGAARRQRALLSRLPHSPLPSLPWWRSLRSWRPVGTEPPRGHFGEPAAGSPRSNPAPNQPKLPSSSSFSGSCGSQNFVAGPGWGGKTTLGSAAGVGKQAATGRTWPSPAGTATGREGHSLTPCPVPEEAAGTHGCSPGVTVLEAGVN